jgi:hypothetical protein
MRILTPAPTGWSLGKAGTVLRQFVSTRKCHMTCIPSKSVVTDIVLQALRMQFPEPTAVLVVKDGKNDRSHQVVLELYELIRAEEEAKAMWKRKHEGVEMPAGLFPHRECRIIECGTVEEAVARVTPSTIVIFDMPGQRLSDQFMPVVIAHSCAPEWARHAKWGVGVHPGCCLPQSRLRNCACQIRGYFFKGDIFERMAKNKTNRGNGYPWGPLPKPVVKKPRPQPGPGYRRHKHHEMFHR